MFGGTGFMVDGALGPLGQRPRAAGAGGCRAQADLLADDGVEPMVKGGRTSRGWVHVQPRVVDDDSGAARVARTRRRGGAGLGQPAP